ncbi:sugar ABC transporter ATP-binding protein [Oryzobacter telluris]|uniref:sugar ABC transporter ATP-binding protein n=1 Tax=Oryzobacter telluris TaxID=3149179 RepID=UPI00370D6DBE
MSPTAAPVVAVEHLGKSYPGVRAVDDVSVTFRPGEVHALVGENGAGKSTLIKVLAGAQRPDTGTITIDGEPVVFSTPGDSARRGFAFIHQEPSLVDDLTVAENVVLGTTAALRWRTVVNRRAMRRRYAEIADQLGLEVAATTRVAELGVAEQTLVALARAMHRDAHFLVFDEPTAALSDQESERLFTVIGSLTGAGRTVVYVSHRLHEVFRLSSTVTVMKDGRHVTTMPTSDLADRDHLVSLILGREHTTEAVAAAARPQPADDEDSAPVVLRVRHLSDGGRVRDVSFDLHAGRVTGMAGLVGAGRTELAALLSGARRPVRGELVLDGVARTFRSPRQAIRAGIALVPEDRRNLGTLRDLSVRDNLTVPFLSRFHLARLVPFVNARRERSFTEGALERLAVKVKHVDQSIADLSGGNQQKVIVSRWVEAGAHVFVFDEPTQGVDVGARAEIYALMRGLAADGAAVLMISSDLEEVVAESDDVLVMREGEVVAHLAEPTERDVLRACYGHRVGATA